MAVQDATSLAESASVAVLRQKRAAGFVAAATEAIESIPIPRSRMHLRTATLALLVFAAGCARNPAPSALAPVVMHTLSPDEKQAEARAIHALARRFSQSRDAAERAALFTDDAWVVWEMADGREPMLLGPDAIREHLARGGDEFARDRSGLMRVADAGDQAYEYGVLYQNHDARDPRDRGPRIGWFSRTWRKINGAWRIGTEIIRRAPS
jgi:ketosteroid isomerase-like protein